MNTLSMRGEPGIKNGVGIAATVAVHVVVVLLLLSSRLDLKLDAMPVAVRILGEDPQPQQQLVMPESKPNLFQPTLHLSQPEIQSVETSNAPAMMVSSSPPPASSSHSEAHAVHFVEPRCDADYLKNPAPPYPRLSRRLREEGVVFLRVLVSIDGLAEQVELKSSSGSERLDEAALVTVRKWRFVPAQRRGQPTSAWVIVPIAFSLNA